MAKFPALLPVVLLLLLCQSALAAELNQLGRIRFPTSASAAAQEHFLNGIAYLHSFGFRQARSEFVRAQRLDPDFALAYWGEALTYNHPLYPEMDTVAPQAALEKLAPGSEERLAKTTTTIEKGFMAAGEAYVFTDGGSLERRSAFRRSMESLYGRYPNHEEVRAFYILSLLSEAASSSPEQRAQMRQLAGLLASRLFADNDSHPGAAHYLIHSYDDPVNAELALPAAERYIEIAPLVSHARHMPSHIYIHLGRWFEVADLNETAFYTARALWRPGDEPDDQLHSIDFGQYGDLQLANYHAVEHWIERAEDTLSQNPDHQGAIALLGRLKARLIVESRGWQYHDISSELTSDEIFAYGLSAVNMRDLTLAREANLLLKERAARQTADIPLLISQLELEASILFSSGNTTDSLAILERAAELALGNPTVDPLPAPIKPPLEMLGELQLRAGQSDQAIETFKTALQLTPHRPWSLLGLARAYAASGNNQEASIYYRELLNSWTDHQLLGVSEAITHLSVHSD